MQVTGTLTRAIATKMTRLQEKDLPAAKRQMVGVRGTEGEERQVSIGTHWFLFRMVARNWTCVQTSTWTEEEMAFER